MCQACSDRYAADAFHLLRAGLAGDDTKNVPTSVVEHPRVFVTLTAPTFGQVHTRKITPRGHHVPCRCGSRHHSDDLVAVPGCLVADPLVAEILAAGRFPPGADVTVRVGARTGARMVVIDGGDHGVFDEPVVVPEGVRVVTGAELAAGKRAWLHEEVAGVRLRVSARSFFQSGPEAAEALVATVGAAAGDVTGTRLADLYGGIGLFAATVGRGAHVELVEASASAAADARVNLAGLDARVVGSDVTRWRARPQDVVIADPPRAGLGRGGVRAVRAAGAPRLVLVSCDAGALGRDAGLLAGIGYRLVAATVVDAFPHTPHVEVVTRFDRA